MRTLAGLARPEPVLAALWLMEIVQLAWPEPGLRRAAGVAMAVYVLLAVFRSRRSTLVLCAPLAAAAVALAGLHGAFGAIVRGFENAAVFMAFFGSIMLLRALADGRPEIARTRAVIAGLGRKEAGGASLLGAHVVGAVLVVGVLALLGAIARDERDDAARRRAAETAQRGMCLAPLWSPFWIAAAFTAQMLPGVPAWEIMSLGLGLAAVGLAVALLAEGRHARPATLARAVRGYAPVLPPVAVCVALVAGLSGIAGLTTLGALIAATPVLALAALAARQARLRPVAAETWAGCALVRDDVVIVTVAVVLGRVLETAIGDLGLSAALGALALPPWAVIACVVGAVSLASLAGIHQLVSVVVVLAAFGPVDTGVADVVMMEAALVGWGFASMIGVTAVSVATASAMFRVPRSRLVLGSNLAYAAVFGPLAVAVLAGVNRLVSGS